MVAQLDILETMTPLEFLEFRDRLESGSGFQSHQFRELEFVAGLEGARRRSSAIPPSSPSRARASSAASAAPTLWDAFLRHLAANGVAVPADGPRARRHPHGSSPRPGSARS